MKKTVFLMLVLSCFLVSKNFAQNTFKFTNEPSNEGCFMKGKSFKAEGKIIAEKENSDKGKSLYFAIKKAEHILMTYVELDASQEATSVSYHYFTKEYLEDVEFASFGSELTLSIENMYSKYKSEECSQFNVQKKTQEMNGIVVGNFKNKKDLEAFKKMLKNKTK